MDISFLVLLAVVVVMLGSRIASFLRRQGGSQAEQVAGLLIIAVLLAILWFILKFLGIVNI